jgi:ADP-heptose:LPS heptosyltransferase
MKVLCLSLLRLGDIVQHRQLVRAVLEKHPGSEVHLLCHSQFAQARDLFSEAVTFHFVPYSDLQKILVERRQHPQAAFEMLKSVLEPLRDLKFERLYDFTHTFFSDTVRKYLAIPEERPDRRWQTYLEDHATVTGGSRFHLMEILARSMKLRLFSEPTSAAASASREKIIVFQTVTSDTKKNWALRNFEELAERIADDFPEYRLRVLAGPGEAAALKNFFSEEQIYVCSMKEAGELLRRASLLVSLDTSLLHLAAQENCPMVGVFLGGADPVKTGPLRDQALLLHGKSACAPCSHVGPCSQSRHLCEDFLSVEQVYRAIQQQLFRQQGEVSNMLLLAERVIFKQGAYSLRDVKLSPVSLEKIFEETIWRYYLDGAWLEELPRVPSETRQFLDEIATASLEQKRNLVRSQKTRVGEFRLCQSKLEEMMQKISLLCIGTAEEPNALRKEILTLVNQWERQFPEQKDLFHRLQLILSEDAASAFELYRRLKSPCEEFRCLVEIRGQFAEQLGRQVEGPQATGVEV